LTVEELSSEAQTDPEGTRAELQTFVHCLLQNKEPPAGPRDGTRATAMVLKAFEAIRTGKTQVLQL
jgi:predicted dehydrogenase